MIQNKIVSFDGLTGPNYSIDKIKILKAFQTNCPLRFEKVNNNYQLTWSVLLSITLLNRIRIIVHIINNWRHSRKSGLTPKTTKARVIYAM